MLEIQSGVGEGIFFKMLKVCLVSAEGHRPQLIIIPLFVENFLGNDAVITTINHEEYILAFIADINAEQNTEVS